MKKSYLRLLLFIAFIFSSGGAFAQVSSYATLPYSTGFETGALDANWYTTSQAGGRIQIWQTGVLTWSTYTAYSHTGNYMLGMDASPGGAYVTNESWMGLNLGGAVNVVLDFWWSEWNDESEPEDGVYFSDNGGSSFTKILDLPGAAYIDLTWYHFTLNVDSACAVHGLNLTSNFVVKFQQRDNYYFAGGNDGHFYDDINVTGVVCGSPPSITCVSNINMVNDPGTCGAAVTWTDPTGTDSCGSTLSVSQIAGPSKGSVFPVGTSTVTYMTSNAAGSDTCSFTVTINDTTPPALSCQSLTVQLDSTGMAIISALDLTASASDPCGIASLTAGMTTFTCADLGTQTVMVTAVDSNGNSSSCTATVMVVDTLGISAPALDMGPDQVLCNDGQAVLSGPPGFGYDWSTGDTTQSITVSTPGTYGLTITNAMGCSASDDVVFTAGFPDPTITQNGDTLCIDAGLMGYQWYLNGSPISGATSNCIVATDPGTYTATALDSGGCALSSDSTVIVSVSNPLAGGVEVEAWPNPFRDRLNLSITSPRTQQLRVEVYSATGVKVAVLFDGKATAGERLDLSMPADDLSAGVYLYRLHTGSGVQTGRVILAR